MIDRTTLWTLAAVLLIPACASGDRPASAASAAPAAAAPVVEQAREETPVAMPKAARVVVNGRELAEAQLAEFKKVYGVVPAAGRWWYDTVSGMYGTEGQGAAGFMYPGHDLGQLAADVSRGTTQVFINGRHLTVAEVNYLAGLVGGAVMPGRYWLDGQLTWGYEGNPYPAGNLLQLAAVRGGGGSDSGTWSGLTGSGSYDQGNTRGYVSIPGVGPIGSYGVD